MARILCPECKKRWIFYSDFDNPPDMCPKCFRKPKVGKKEKITEDSDYFKDGILGKKGIDKNDKSDNNGSPLPKVPKTFDEN